MSNLNNNTATLESLLVTINALPEASSVETCQVTITSNGNAKISYTTISSGQIEQRKLERFVGTKTLTVVKNTMMFISQGFDQIDYPWLEGMCYADGVSVAAFIIEDCSTTLND